MRDLAGPDPSSKDADDGEIFTRLGTVVPGMPLNIECGKYIRLDVLSGNTVVPVLVWRNSDHNNRLLVAFNGAVSRSEDKDPRDVFQRRTWVEDIDANVVFIADPTLRSDNRISIGWGQGTRSSYAIPAMALAAQYVAAELRVESNRRVYFGSSAGGFQALQIGARDPESQVLVNNAQFDWTKYSRPFVNTICSTVYGLADIDTIIKQHQGRTSAIAYMKERGEFPRIRYLLNAGSSSDARVQLRTIIEELAGVEDTILGLRFEITVYSHSGLGHNPLPKAKTIEEIHKMFERASA